MIQIGTRWQAGFPPPSSVPGALAAALVAYEQSVGAEDLAGQYWTLTWQEHVPSCRLDDGNGVSMLRDGSIVSLDGHGNIDDDDWLEG